MADPRTFTLIGEFKDGITPELQKINNQLAALKSNFAGVGSKKNTGFRGATQEIGKLVSAHKKLAESVKGVQSELRSTVGVLQQYRREMGKAAAATRAFQKSGGNLGSDAFAKNMRRANTEAQAYLRTLQQINKQSPRTMRPPTGGGGGGRGGRGGGGGAGGGPGGFHMAEFGFAYTLGSGIAQPIQNAVVQGFQIGVSFMTKPFEYFANRLGERMQDELSDLKAAGGFFSMAKRQESPFVKNFADAIQFTQENNKVMARLAASLPGKTQDYIEVAKRVSDSVARTVLNDRAATMKMAEQIRAGDIRTYGAKSITEMTGSEATRKTIQVLLGDLTKDTVLAGMGGRAGAGGAMGAYGLPQLSERMISQDEVSMGQMQRYSAIFSDPMIMDALQRNIDKINATSKNSADRLQAIANMYKEIVTPELVERYRRTLAGVAETFNTAIFGEETGLFGLGRKMEGLGVKFNEYGQMLDKFGKVTTDLTQAAREDLAIYDLFRDILVNVGQVLAPIVENLSMIYDPLKQLGIDLNKAREVTYKILQSFNYYKKGFEEFGQQFKGKDKELFDATRDLRAALATVGNVLRYFKVIGEGDFANLIKQLEDPKANMGEILKGMIDQFMTSDVAAKIGEFIGTIIGTVLTEVAKVTGFLSGRIASSNKLFEGLKKGFEDAGGTEAIKNIFKDVFKSLFNVLVKIMTLIPLEGYMLMGFMLVAPAAAQALGMAIGSKIAGLFGELPNLLGPAMKKGAVVGGNKGKRLSDIGASFLPGTESKKATRMLNMQKRGAQAAASARAAATRRRAEVFGNQYTSPIGPLPQAFAKGPGGPVMASQLKGLPKALKGISEFGKNALPFAKKLPGLSIALGALDFGLRKAAGESTAVAAGGAIGGTAGGIAGATLGSALGPVGTVAGGVLGAWLGDWLGSEIGKAIQSLGSTLSNLPGQLQNAWIGLETWLKNLPYNLGVAVGRFTVMAQDAFVRFFNWLSGLSTQFGEWVNKTVVGLRLKWNNFINQVSADFQSGALWGKLATALINGFKWMMNNVISNLNPVTWVQRGFQFGQQVAGNFMQGYRAGQVQQRSANPAPKLADGTTMSTVFNRAKGGLGDAIASEMRMKPPGSDLVIANSSETVIPAAGGHGMQEFMGILSSGFSIVNQQYKSLASGVNLLTQETNTKFQQAETTNADRYQKTSTSINNYHRENQAEFGKINQNILQLSQKVATMSSMGGMMGAGGMALGSGYGSAGMQIAGQLGNFIKQTGGAPGSIHEHPMHGGVKGKHAPGSYHYSGRAIDIGAYANEQAGVIARIQQFNAKMGVKPVEFLHAGNDPRGHSDHVHVAYGLGAGNPAFFSSQSAAERWERSMVSGSVRVGSVTGNSTEGFGGSNVGDIYVTVNAGATNDPDQLAYMVAERIQTAVSDAVNSNILV